MSSHYQILPAEVHKQIASHLSSQEFLSICFTSKILYARYSHLVYQTVDLSLHHSPHKSNRFVLNIYNCSGGHENGLIPLTSNDRDVVAACSYRQELFMQQLSQHPERAKFVQDLRWTILLPARFIPCHKTPFHGSASRVRNLFLQLTEVKHVDLAYGNVGERAELAFQSRDQLFPLATSVQLCGIIGRRLIKAILRPDNIGKIQDLSLDSLQTIIREPSSSRASRIPLEAVPSLYPLSLTTGRCPALKSLTIRIEWPDRWYGSSQLERRRQQYADLVEYLESVKGSLESFVLDCHGVRGLEPVQWQDLRFGIGLYPVILSGPWPRLRTLCMNIIGVPIREDPQVIAERIRLALGPGVECFLPRTESLAPWVRTAEKGNLLTRIREGVCEGIETGI